MLLLRLAVGLTCVVFAVSVSADVRVASALQYALVDFSSTFGDIEGTFVLADGQSGEVLVHNAERARTHFIPASTFKIPNALIALDTAVADGAGFVLSRDPTLAPRADWWPQSWLEDHTLATALRASVVWFYQDLARRIGVDRMQAMLDRFDYGNTDISGGIDQFWLTGGLRISAHEQVDFLRKFYSGGLGASASATRVVKDAILLEETKFYRFSGKTGWAGLGEAGGCDVGWLVGYVERGKHVYFYAMNIQLRTGTDAAERMRITREILVELGLLIDD